MSDKETPAAPAPPRRVTPVEDQAFWDALDNGNLVLARCTCGAYYARLQACLRCGTDAQTLTWVPAAGRGTVCTVVVFDQMNVEISMPVRMIIGERGEYKIHQASARM